MKTKIMTGIDLIDAVAEDRHHTVIFYENIYPALSIFKRLIDRTDEDMTVLAVSGVVLRTLNEMVEHAGVNLKGARVVTLNLNGQDAGETSFSCDRVDELIEYIKGLRGTLTVLCRGMLKIASDNHLRVLFDIIDSASDELKVVVFTNWSSYTSEEIGLISGMFDVAIHIRKTDDVFSFGEEIYELHVMQSVVPYIQPGTVYFRVSEDMEMIEHG